MIMHLLTRRKLPWLTATKCGCEVLPYPPYSPDLALSDFYLFPKLKTNFRGRNFGSNDGVIDAVNEWLGDQDEDFYFEGISKLEQRWRKCTKMKGDYIEKIMANFSFLGIPKYTRPRTFHTLSDHTSYIHIFKQSKTKFS